MKNLVFSTILLLLFSLKRVSGQDVAFLKAPAPFPYSEGVALSSTTYQAVKAKLAAAEDMKQAADSAVASLQQTVQALEVALFDKKAIIDHDSRAYQKLFIQYTQAIQQLQRAQADVQDAEQLIESVRSLLPKRVRKRADTPDKIAIAVDDYILKLRKRPLRWGLIGLAVGIGTGVSLTI